MELLYIFYVAVFYLGTILGSFLNVVALDLQKLFTENNLAERNEFSFLAKHITQRYFWQSLLSRRSHCDNCQSTLRSFELFPLFSYLFQKGACKNCKTSIDSSHLWVELLCGVYFLGIFHVLFWQFSTFSGAFILTIFFWFVVFGLLFIAALFDYRTKLLPDVVLASVGLLLVLNSVYDLGQGFVVPEINVYIAAILFAGLFYGAWFVSRGQWIGFADGKLAFLIGLLFGISQGFTALAISFWVGAAISVALLCLSRWKKTNELSLSSAVPFGPFMVFAIWYVFVWDINLFAIAL